MRDQTNDEALVELFFARDEQALALTERQYGRYMRALSLDVVGDARDSEECASDALMALWTHIPPDKPRCFKAYLTRIVRRLSLMKYREKHAEKRAGSNYTLALEDLTDSLFDALDVDAQLENRALARLIDGFLSTLDEKRRYVFIARYCLSQSPEDIARTLGVSRSTVFHDLSVMKEKLREKLKEEGFTP